MGKIKVSMSLQNRNALVTGANGHIGREICKTLAEMGAGLILVDMPGSDYAELTEEIKSSNPGTEIRTIDCDLESEQAREVLINKVTKDCDFLNVLINNAAFVGTSDLDGWVTDFHSQSVETWRRAHEVNLHAAFHLTRDLSPLIKSSGHGSIINIGSIYAKYGPDFDLYEGTGMGNAAAYATSKAGLLQFTRWIATYLAPDVRVNSISPGGVFRNQPEKFVTKYINKVPMNRMATEEDFCGAIAFLASDMSAYITGQDIAVDGGWGVW
jgi:NAD(P)-dependent dehydrogenase (short-subunit alcohol dehydrogenase family)